MLKYLLLSITTVSLLGGCSSTPDYYDYKAPYCYTDEIVQLKDGDKVSGIATHSCTDRPGQQVAMQRAGIDAGCKEFWYNEFRNGKIIPTRGVYCEKLDGSTEIVNINGINN